MLLTPLDWLLLGSTALGVVGTGYGQWKLRRERQDVARKLAQKEWVDWCSAQTFIDEGVLAETGCSSLEDLKKGYWQLVRAISSSAGHVSRQDDFSLATERLRSFSMIQTVIRHYQSPFGREELRAGNAIFDADTYGWEFPEIARRLHGLSLHQIAGLGVYMLRQEGLTIEKALVDMGLRKDTVVDANR